jgi:hypothetical protein
MIQLPQMRNLLIVLFAVAVFGCRKTSNEPPSTEPPPEPVNSITVKINGTAFACSGCVSSYKSGGMHGINFNIPNTADRLLFTFSSYPAPGTYNFVKYGNPAFVYQKNNVYYRAVNGGMTLTSVDTSSNGSINKLYCTFNCNTDTTAGTFFSFTEGVTRVQ